MQNITDKDFQKNLASKVHEHTLDKMHDIDGLDAVNFWPLAPIWWILIAAASIILLSIMIYYIRRALWIRSWQGQTTLQLDKMQKSLNENNSQLIATELSEILKRAAMQKYTRKECAAIEGENWLKLLKKYDSHNFDWQKYGEILTKDIYAPPMSKISLGTLNKLLNATKNWVK